MHPAIRLLLSLQVSAALVACAGPSPERVARAPLAARAGTAATADRAPAVADPSLIHRGYQARIINGELKYCRAESVTGSLFSKTVCLSPGDIQAREDSARSSVEMAHRGDGGCAKTPCN